MTGDAEEWIKVRDRLLAAHERILAARRHLERTVPLVLDPVTKGIVDAVDTELGQCERALWQRIYGLDTR